jgi:hypothetical protein
VYKIWTDAVWNMTSPKSRGKERMRESEECEIAEDGKRDRRLMSLERSIQEVDVEVGAWWPSVFCGRTQEMLLMAHAGTGQERNYFIIWV